MSGSEKAFTIFRGRKAIPRFSLTALRSVRELLLSQDGWTNDSVLLLLQVPEETASARVTVTGRMANMIQPVETVEGTQLAQGVWEFRFPIDPELTTDYGETGEVRYEGRALEGLPYVLELYGADGTPLLERSDTLPDSGIEESYSMSFYDRREG